MRVRKTTKAPYLNFLRAKYEMYTGAVAVESYPSYVGIDPSSACNLRCPTCATGIEYESVRGSGERIVFRNRTLLSVELFDALLEEMGDYLFLIMFFNWGEPLLNKNLPAMIRKAAEREIETDIHTNLSLPLSARFLEELLSAGLGSLGASLDGFSQETYETYRRGGDLALARENLERLVAIRDRLGLATRIVWNFLVFSFNEHEIPAVETYCRDLGIGFNARDAWINDPEWLPSYRKVEPSISPPGQMSVWSPTGEPEAPASRSAACGWHYGFTMINADGSLSPCCASEDQKNDLGTVRPGEQGFTEVWNNPRYQNSRAAFAGRPLPGGDEVETLCMQCPFDEGIQSLYTVFDDRVLRQFEEVLQRSEPLLGEAFRLLADRPSFVEFYQRHRAQLSAAPPTARPRPAPLRVLREW
jgi:MoaA/NifB/PqqE/SkfB family radical SAM enzyme